MEIKEVILVSEFLEKLAREKKWLRNNYRFIYSHDEHKNNIQIALHCLSKREQLRYTMKDEKFVDYLMEAMIFFIKENNIKITRIIEVEFLSIKTVWDRNVVECRYLNPNI